MMPAGLVVVGTSWGGLSALSSLLAELAPAFPLPLVLVQHRGSDPRSVLRDLLQECTDLAVREVEDKEQVLAGTVFLAPPDYHLLVDRDHFTLSMDPPVRFSRPSIDVTFGTAADAYGPALVGVVLTGANEDGARGLRCIADRGGLPIVQDPATAESAVMPAAARRLVPTAEVLSITGIARRLGQLANASGAAAAGRPAGNAS